MSVDLGQSHRQEPATTRAVRLGLGHTRDVSMLPDRALRRDGRWSATAAPPNKMETR
jgi:hypothetical protein